MKIKDYKLSELKEICEKKDYCGQCPLYNNEESVCEVLEHAPQDWFIEDKPFDTLQEVQKVGEVLINILDFYTRNYNKENRSIIEALHASIHRIKKVIFEIKLKKNKI